MASQTLDDTVVALMSMGFEYQDAHDAIQCGKLAVQDAIEWILAGKPDNVAGHTAPPTLRLSQNGQNSGMPSLRPDTAAPFVTPLPVPPHTTSSSTSTAGASAQPLSPGATAAASSSDMDMEQQVVSRLHLTDAKLAEKKHFEDKVRADVEKKARMEKLQAKRERDRVLKEIAEDRKMSKLMKTHGTQSKPTASPSESSTSAAAQKPAGPSSNEASPSTSTTAAQHTHCSIQIRLPNGRQLRKRLEVSTTLGKLWLDVLKEAAVEVMGYTGFMQPFPRHEFSAVEMNKTLEQLGLVPSGSLVLKKDTPADSAVDLSQQGVAAVRQDPTVPEAEADPEAEAGRQLPQLPQPSHPPYPHNPWEPVEPRQEGWGRGRPLNQHMNDADDESNNEDADMADEDNDNRPEGLHHWGRGRRLEGNQQEDDNLEGGDDDDDLVDEWFAQQNAGGQAAGANPLLQGFMGQRMGWMGGHQVAFGGVGQRLVPEGVPGADNHVNRRVGDLAAEAAQERLARPQPPEDAPGPSTARPMAPLVLVRQLEDLSMEAVIQRITCQSSPIHSLGRLPESLSEKLLHYLVQRHLLDAKTLRLFCSCLLRKLMLDTYNYATNDLLNAVRLHPNLQVLSLQSCPLISDRGISCIADLKKLKVLNLGLCKQITNKSLKVIAGFPKLHTLNLEETGVTESGLIDYLAHKPCLRNLNLNRTAVTDAVFQQLRYLEHLETLCLEETKVTNLDGVGDLRKLTALNLAWTLIGADSLQHLVHHPTLRHLSLANTENLEGDTALLCLAGLKLRTLCLPDRHTVTNAGLAHIVSFPLHMLDLTNYIHVSDDGMQHVAKITTLETLMLSNTKVTDVGLRHLSTLTQLRSLHLDRTTITDVGIRIVTAFKELSELSLSATNVTNRFLKEGVLQSCQGLTKLNLSRTHVGDKGVMRLSLPHLSLVNLDCTGVHAHVVDTLKANNPALRSVTTANLTPLVEMLGEEEEEEDFE